MSVWGGWVGACVCSCMCIVILNIKFAVFCVLPVQVSLDSSVLLLHLLSLQYSEGQEVQ